MSKFSFRDVKKAIWPVELPDGRTITIRQPTKADADVLQAVLNTSDISEIYPGLAYILSCNAEQIEFSVSDVESAFDFQDLTAFFSAYTEFLLESSDVKN